MLAGFFHVTKMDVALVFQALKSCGFEGTGNKIMSEIKIQLQQFRSCLTNEKIPVASPGLIQLQKEFIVEIYCSTGTLQYSYPKMMTQLRVLNVHKQVHTSFSCFVDSGEKRPQAYWGTGSEGNSIFRKCSCRSKWVKKYHQADTIISNLFRHLFGTLLLLL